MDFEVIVDSDLLTIWPAADIAGAPNNRLLSVINDFEDGHWRLEKFDNFIWDNIAETALSLSERSALKGLSGSVLKSAAKNLRLSDASSDFGKGSELAEVVLYGIMKYKYSALPVVPKIFYKQNSQDNAKGEVDPDFWTVFAAGISGLRRGLSSRREGLQWDHGFD